MNVVGIFTLPMDHSGYGWDLFYPYAHGWHK